MLQCVPETEYSRKVNQRTQRKLSPNVSLWLFGRGHNTIQICLQVHLGGGMESNDSDNGDIIDIAWYACFTQTIIDPEVFYLFH